MPVQLVVTLLCDTCDQRSAGVATINTLKDWDMAYPEGWEVVQESVPESDSTNAMVTVVRCPDCKGKSS